jgi:nucleotide-binding universal stress UspA family protein
MDYKSILVQLDETARRSERLAVAFDLAARFGAHLTAQFSMSATFIPVYAIAEAGAVALAIDQEYREKAMDEAEREFRAAAARAPVQSDWRVLEQADHAHPGRAARGADLIVAGQPEPKDGAGKAFAADLVLSAGRPVLFVPYAGRFSKPGRRPLVAWNGGREAARAVADALPLLKRADAVHVVTFDARAGEGAAGDVALQLARHGVKVTLSRESVPDVAVGEQILSRAADLESDLLVMGAYGHSRMREQILGGATRTLLESMTLPTLMSH